MNEATRKYIQEHAEGDVRLLALQGTKNPEINLTFALEQIVGRQKARTKLPSWAAIDGIVYPPHLALEQCSSETTAAYKAKLVSFMKEEGKELFVDLTGGYGVDFSWIAPCFERAVYVERQTQLCAISSENFKRLKISADIVNGDGKDYLHSLSHASLIFLDPARRDVHGARTYGLADCTPNILEMMNELMGKTDWLMLKLSPMLDWQKTVDDIQQTGCAKVNEVHILSVGNECKELLLLISKQETSIRVCCVNNDSLFEFNVSGLSRGQAHQALPQVSVPMTAYLYEPNASVMKAGCFDLLAERFKLSQLDKNSHLFFSGTEVNEFPGRQFIIERITTMNKRDLKEALRGIDKANITVRNFPLSVAELRKRLKLKDGGETFIFATTVTNEGHLLFVCRKKS